MAARAECWFRGSLSSTASAGTERADAAVAEGLRAARGARSADSPRVERWPAVGWEHCRIGVTASDPWGAGLTPDTHRARHAPRALEAVRKVLTRSDRLGLCTQKGATIGRKGPATGGPPAALRLMLDTPVGHWWADGLYTTAQHSAVPLNA
jgi:hypothetical protein